MDDPPVAGRWRALALVAAAVLLAMSLWFGVSAVSGELAVRWALSDSAAAWLTTSVQLGFVAGTAAAALLNVADLVPSRFLFAASALAAAAVNATIAIAPSYGGALAARFLTGLCLAGVYPPAMKMAATWFRSRRGLAIGIVVGALTAGKALPYLVRAIPGAGAERVVLALSAGATLGALLVGASYRDGPYAFPSRAFSWGLLGTVARERPWRLATGGYLGHMFELYACWTWLPAFLAASEMARAAQGHGSASSVALSGLSFAGIAIGGVGCVLGGLWADRVGRERVVTVSLLASGSCAIIVALLFGSSLALLAPVVLLWGIFVIADSAQFSALVTESVPAHAVGTALTLQTSLGFLLTAVTVQLVPVVAAAAGWRVAMAGLAIGPVLGIAAVRRLVRMRAP